VAFSIGRNNNDYDDEVGRRYSDEYDASIGAPVAHASAQARAAFLQKVYLTLTGGVAIMMATAFWLTQHAITALAAGQTDWLVSLMSGRAMWLVFLVYIVMAMAAMGVARVKGVNLLVYGAFTVVTGFLLSPLFLIAYTSAGQSYGVIWNAFGITALVFVGLSGYVIISRQDFSFLGGALTIGILVLLGFMIGTFFFHAPAFMMGVTVGGLLLFGLFVLYDTSVIMNHLEADEWVAGALRLFVDFINLFIRILSLLSQRR